MVEDGDTVIVIDTGYEFRLSAIRAEIKKIDAVLYTHSHSDHIMGLDDLRVFTHERSLPLYGSRDTMDHIENVFSYAFSVHDWPHMHVDKEEEDALRELKKHNYGLPLLERHDVSPYESFRIGSLEIKALPVMHGMMEIYGYRIGKFTYITDVSKISERTMDEIRGTEVLVLGALRERRHPTHFTFKEAYDVARESGCRLCYFTHINHETSYEDINRRYAPLCLSSYDNLSLEV